MAYMSQEHKARIRALLKIVVPSDWKWSLSVHNHSTIVFTVWAAPVDIPRYLNKHYWPKITSPATHAELNSYHIRQCFMPAGAGVELADTFARIKEALDLDNYDRSEPMMDYFCVGHYVDIRIGRWDRPFKYEPERARVAVR